MQYGPRAARRSALAAHRNARGVGRSAHAERCRRGTERQSRREGEKGQGTWGGKCCPEGAGTGQTPDSLGNKNVRNVIETCEECNRNTRDIHIELNFKYLVIELRTK